MRIFTSWSGDRSKAAALGLRTLLEQVFPETVQVFVSDDISPGQAWAQRLGDELDQSEFGILCLTRENWQSPWLLFEAGALAKRFASSARVVPYLIDDLPPEADRSPLGQFQHVRSDRDGTYRLVECINSIRQNPRPSDKLREAFKPWWADFEQTLNTLPVNTASRLATRSDRELLEIILRRLDALAEAGHDPLPALPPSEIAHLRNLRDNPDLEYRREVTLQKELRHRRDLGLIRNRKPIADLPSTFRLGQHFDMTDKGKVYVQNVAPASGNPHDAP